MGEVMNVNMEKNFFTFILENPSQFSRVENYFFKNDNIQFIFTIVKDEYLRVKKVPSPQQIVDMIKLNDPEGKISNDIIKIILKNNIDDKREWVDNRFRAWKISNSVRDNTSKVIEELRSLDDIDLDNVKNVVSKIKNLYNNIPILEENEEDLGDDFDDPNNHKQDISVYKIPTGWSSMDKILSGGWDLSTFSVLMGETNVGKCQVFDTFIKINNKINGEKKKIKIGEFYNILKTNNFNNNSYIDKFIDTIEIDEWEVETDTGWSDIRAIGKTIEYEEWVLKTKNNYIICADTHIIFNENMDEVFVKDLNLGDKIITKNGIEEITDLFKNNKSSNMYDLQLDDDNHRFYSNNILSHNSMWLHNIGVNASEQGKVVVIITLEMASRKVMKRLGSMRLKIDIDQYDELSKDSTFIKNKINQVKSKNNGMFNTDNPGKIFVKKYNTSDCSILDIDNYINKLQETKNIKVDMILVDYINIMSVDSSARDIRNNLYMKGKHLAEGLRYLADKYETAVITATQLDRAVWGAKDVKLNDIPESKAIAETADTVWAIIRTPAMKKENKYKLKILKLRDGEHKEEQIRFDFNTKYLLIENDMIDGVA